MSKFFSLNLILISLFCVLMLGGCGTMLSSIEKQENIKFKVNNPNASYFDVHIRSKFLQKSNDKVLLSAKSSEFDCSSYPNPAPVNYYLVMPAFYENRSGWSKANAPLEKFERYITRLSELYVTTANNSYAKCLAKVLNEWAEKGSLLSFDYEGNSKQAWYGIQWTTASAGMAYSIIKDNPSIGPELKHKIEIWLRKVAKRQISWQGGPTSCCNNHSYWRGLEAAIVGVVTNDQNLFRFGIKKYISALNSMNKDGSFPYEMDRGKRALHYQNFAVLPLVYIAEIASRQGYNLYDLKINDKDLHLAINFLMKGINNIEIIKKKTGYDQDTSFIYKKRELNWVEPYVRRFRNEDIETFLEQRRPIYHRWSGGNSTLYFYNPDTKQ